MSANTMADEGFLRRWARLKSAPEPVAPVATDAPAPPAVQAPPIEDERPRPTLDDVARLTPESDYSAFVAKGVDQAVRRMALKKLFADPNFAVMDGLDIYIADYNKAAPLSEAMLASLRHAPGLLDRLLGDAADEAGAPPHPTPDARPDASTAPSDPPAGCAPGRHDKGPDE